MIRPVEIREEAGGGLTITWSDGRTDGLTATSLRRNCPCATCVDEWTGQKRLDDSTVAENITMTEISLTGRYAVSIGFSDGHGTGIFTFDRLRDIGSKNG